MAIREQVAGPGKLAKRTDKNVSKQPTRYIGGGTYGEGKEILEQQQAAPMAAGSQMSANLSPAAVQGMMEKIVPLMAPTQRPTEPLSAGMNFGAGPGREAMNLPIPSSPTLTSVLEELMKFDDTGDVAAIYNSVIDSGL